MPNPFDLLTTAISAITDERFSDTWWPQVAVLINEFSKNAREDDMDAVAIMLNEFEVESRGGVMESRM